MLLTKRRRNDLFDVLVNARLDPMQWQQAVHLTDAKLFHNSTTSYLALKTPIPINRASVLYDPEPVIYSVDRSIGDERVLRDGIVHGWSRVMTVAQSWAPRVRIDIETRDLWADLQRWREILSGSGHEAISNTLFSSDERVRLAARMDEIKLYLARTYSLSTGQMSQVVDKLDEAKIAAERIGRKDWMLLFLGLIFTLIIMDIVPPHAVQHIFATLLHGLAPLFSGNIKPRAVSQ